MKGAPVYATVPRVGFILLPARGRNRKTGFKALTKEQKWKYPGGSKVSSWLRA